MAELGATILVRGEFPSREAIALVDTQGIPLEHSCMGGYSEVIADTLDLTLLNELVDRAKDTGSGLIPVLQQAQEIYGYLPKEVLARIALRMSLSSSQVLGVASFLFPVPPGTPWSSYHPAMRRNRLPCSRGQ